MIHDPDLALHARIFIKRHLIFPKEKLIVGHGYRGGSTLITNILFRDFGLFDSKNRRDISVYQFRDQYYNEELNAQLSIPLFQEWMKSPDYHRIKFVRCPYRRAVSSYLYTMGKEMEGEKARIRPLRADFPQFTKKKQVFMSFRVFLQLLSRLNLEVFSSDNHYSKQFLYSEQKLVNYDTIYRLEELDSALEELYQRYNITDSDEIHVQQKRLQNHHLQFRDDIDECVAEWQYHDLYSIPEKGRWSFPHYRYFYNEQTQALVEELYQKDLEEYNYSFHPEQW